MAALTRLLEDRRDVLGERLRAGRGGARQGHHDGEGECFHHLQPPQ